MDKDGNPRKSIEALILRDLMMYPNSYASQIQGRIQVGYEVQPMLTRLINKGLIVWTGLTETSPWPGGKRRKLYAITDTGRAVEMRLRKRQEERA